MAVTNVLVRWSERGIAVLERKLARLQARYSILRSQLRRAILIGGPNFERNVRFVEEGMNLVGGAIRDTRRRLTGLQNTSTQTTSRLARFGAGIKSATVRVTTFIRRVTQLAFTLGLLGGALVRVSVSLAKTGGSFIVAQQQFKNTADILSTTATSLLPRLDKALLGGASNMEIMRLANFALATGLKVTDEEIVRLAAASSRLAKVHGRDTTDAFQRLTFGIVKQERRILDELGIVVRAADIFKDFAAAQGIVGRELTANEKLQAFFTTTLKAAEEQVKGFTNVNFELAAVGDRITASFQNFVNELGEIFVRSGAANELLEALGDAFENILGFLRDPKVATQFFRSITEAVVGLVNLVAVLTPQLLVVLRILGNIATVIANVVSATARFFGFGVAEGGGARTGASFENRVLAAAAGGGVTAQEAGREIGAAVEPALRMNREAVEEMAAVVRRQTIQPESVPAVI